MNADWQHLSPWLLVVAPIVIVFAYTIFGISGFGSTIIAVPLLAHFLPVAFLVPMMVLLDLAAALLVGTAGREHVSREEMKNILPFMFVGIVVGVTVLVKVPEDWLRAALGVFALTVGAWSIANPALVKTISKWWKVPVGIAGGSIATVFGAGGPIYAAYLSGRLKDKSEIRATMSALISISAFTRSVVYALSGLLLHSTILIGALILAPLAWAGLKLGSHIHVGLTQEQMRRVIGVLLVLTGLSLLARVVSQSL
jgi:uncharacterized membrane protein YfcA